MPSSRWTVRNGKDIRHGVAALRDTCEYDAAGTISGAMLTAGARFVPLQVAVANSLTRLRSGLRHPLAIKSIRGCSERLPQGFPRHPVLQDPRR